jgi:hypothetical protein
VVQEDVLLDQPVILHLVKEEEAERSFLAEQEDLLGLQVEIPELPDHWVLEETEEQIPASITLPAEVAAAVFMAVAVAEVIVFHLHHMAVEAVVVDLHLPRLAELALLILIMEMVWSLSLHPHLQLFL